MAGLRLVLLAAGCGLIVAPPASAAVTLGTDPAAPATRAVDCIPGCPVAFVQDRVNGTPLTAPNGVITSFAVQARGPVSLIAYRPIFHDDREFVASGVGRATVHGTGPGTVARAATRLRVRRGDVLGIKVPSGSLLYGVDSAGSRVFFGAVVGPKDMIETQEVGSQILRFSATVEPDADRDGHGDDTQDRCPSNAFAHGACPRPRRVALVSRTVGVSGGRALTRLRNPNGFAVTGSVALTTGGRSAGRASFRLSPGETKTVRATLSRSTRSRLARKGSVGLRYRVTARGSGHRLTTNGTLTVRRKR